MVRWCAAVAVMLASTAWAADAFESQVYQGEHNEPLQAGLELHFTVTPAGHTTPDYAGQTPLGGTEHLTFEPSLGLTEWLEVGAYLQLSASPTAGGEYAGWKARAKLIVPERFKLPVRLGLNLEIGQVPKSVEEAGWANELRPIIGYDVWRFSFSLNPIIGYALSGPAALKPELEPAFKAAYDTQVGVAVGVEYFASLGRFDQGFLPLAQQEHLAFLAVDLVPVPGHAPSAWELNFGLGRALTQATPQQWVAKAIVGRTF